MATMRGRKVHIKDDTGQIREGVVSEWTPSSAWMKVIITDGKDELKQRMVHATDWVEVIREEVDEY